MTHYLKLHIQATDELNTKKPSMSFRNNLTITVTKVSSELNLKEGIKLSAGGFNASYKSLVNFYAAY